MPANKKLFKIKEAINKLFDDHKEASARAVAAHTKKPAMPSLSSEHRRLIRAGFLTQDPNTGRCAINKEQIFYYQMLESCRVLVSDIKMPVKEAFFTYRKLDVCKDFGPIFNQELLTDEDNRPASAHHEALLFLKMCAAQLHAQLRHTVNRYSLGKPKAEQAGLEGASLRDTLASLDDIKASCDGGLIAPSAGLTAE